MAAIKVEPLAEPKDGVEAGKLWLRRMAAAIDWRVKHWSADPQWKRAINLDKGIHWESNTRGEDASSDNPRENITVNLTGSYDRDFLSFLFKNSPKFICKPRRQEDVIPARLQQELVNYFWREKKWRKQARRAVRDMITLGVGIIRTGWVLELDEAAKPDEHGQIEYNDAVRKNEPIVRRVRPSAFVIDPSAPESDLESARWVAEVFRKTLSDVLANDRYDNGVRKKIQDGTYTPTRVPHSEENDRYRPGTATNAVGVDEEEGTASEIVRIFDLWDKKYRRHYLILDGVEEPLVAENWPYEHLDGFPFVMALYDELNDEIYGVGLPYAMEDQQLELNRIRTSSFLHRRRFGKRRLQIMRAAVDESELAKLQHNEDGDIIVNAPNAISAIEHPSLPTDGDRVEAGIKEDVRALIGADQLTSGGSLPGRTSATEINARSSYTGQKIDSRVQAVDDFMTEITSQVIKHTKAYMDSSQVLLIQGPAGQSWAEVNRQNIRAETDLEIITVSAERKDETTERQQALQVMEMLFQNFPLLQQSGYTVNVPKVLEWVIGQHFDVRDFSEFVVQTPPPMVNPQMVPGAQGANQQQPPGIPPQQQAAQAAAVRPESALKGAMNGRRGG